LAAGKNNKSFRCQSFSAFRLGGFTAIIVFDRFFHSPIPQKGKDHGRSLRGQINPGSSEPGLSTGVHHQAPEFPPRSFPERELPSVAMRWGLCVLPRIQSGIPFPLLGP